MSANCTYIHKDRGEKNEKETLWYLLDGSRTKIYPFIVLPKKTNGLPVHESTQIINLETFLFSIQIYKLELYHRFSRAHYTSKSTQKWDTVRSNYRFDVLLLRGLRDYLMKIILRQFNQTTSIMEINSWDRHQMMRATKLDWNLVFTRG
jgi:hypothetical protein